MKGIYLLFKLGFIYERQGSMEVVQGSQTSLGANLALCHLVAL